MRVLIVAIAFFIYTFLFQKAAGTLNILKLNIISFSYYLSLVFGFVGASLVFCGFRDHYLIERVTDGVIDKTYFILLWGLMALPLAICVFNRLFGIADMGRGYHSMLERGISARNSDVVWLIVAVLGVCCLFSILYVFSYIGYFPLSKLFYEESGVLATERIRITHSFNGNIYIRNIVMLMLTPVLSYLSYIYMRVSRQRKWRALFIFLFLCSIIAKTYNFEKSPVIWYIFYFYVLEILLGNIRGIKYLAVVGMLGAAIILGLYYIVFDYSGPLLSLSSGPGGRIFMSQIAGLFLHVQAFPDLCPYLDGASLPGLYGKALGLDESWVRSGRVVMELFNPSGVKNGTAGVMTTIFVGEAYANWGLLGVALAPVCVGFLYSLISCCFLRQGKTPLTIVFYLIIFMSFSQILLGGFVDYLYPLQAAIMGALLLGVSIFKNRGKVRYMVSRW